MSCLVLSLAAQTSNLPRKMMNGKEYYVYKVEKGEGFYSIEKKFDISQEEVIKFNPSAKNGLKRGQVLFIPTDKSDYAEEGGNYATPFEHTIKRGETLYAIAKMYGVTVDEICQLNPGSRKRINAGSKLLIPQKNSNAATRSQASAKSSAEQAQQEDAEQSYIYHTIASGETLHAIARQYQSDVESIMRANPGIKPTKLSKGAVIRVPSKEEVAEKAPVEETTDNMAVVAAKEVKQEVATTPEKNYKTYVAKKKETFYSIAQKFDTTIAEIRAVNPGVHSIREGMTINLPEKATPQQEEIAEENNQDDSKELLEDIYNRIYTKKDANHINVAIILPFMLKEGNDVKSDLYTEYYQGFLLAVDSLKRQGYSINLSAYDSEGSTDVVRNILHRPGMSTMDMIIAPDQEEAIDLIADFGERHDINVVNTFSMKNEKINTNSRVFQTNIPGSYFYAETVDRFIKLFNNRSIVLLEDKDDKDKNEFITLLKEELNNHNIAYSTCTYSGTLMPENLDALSQLSSAVIVPTSNKKEVLARILPSLTNFEKNTPQCDISLFGYPNWIPQVNRYLDDLHQLDTYIFSRFYANPDDSRMYDLSLKYLYWYNEEMKNASPKYALLGFDTGMYFMSAIAQNGKNFANYNLIDDYSSIQTDFHFERINNWSGFINKSFYFVHLTPDMRIEKLSK